MPRHALKTFAFLVAVFAAVACDNDTTSVNTGPTFMRMRLIVTNPADTIFVRRYGDCAVFDSASVGGAFTQVAETLRVNVGVPATITVSMSDNNGVPDNLANSNGYQVVVAGLRSKVGTLTWAQTTDFAGTLTGSAVTNPPASNDSASIRIGLLNKTSGDTVYDHTCPVRVTVR